MDDYDIDWTGEDDYNLNDDDDFEYAEDDYCNECHQYIDDEGLCGCVERLYAPDDDDEDEFGYLNEVNKMYGAHRLG